MIQAVIFDLDDTIVNSSPLHFEAYEKALKKFGLKSPDIPPDLRRRIYGMRIKEIMELLVSNFKMDVNVGELTDWRNRYFLEIVKKGVKPMPGLYGLVENVKKWGLKRAVASSGLREYVNEVLRQLKLLDFFGAVVTAEDVVNPKPFPEVFLTAAERIGVPPSQCLAVEDATAGIEAAKRAGMKVAAIRTDSGQDLSMADLAVDSLDEITLEKLGRAS